MGRRLEDGTWQDSCLAKLRDGEPFFVLRGGDTLSQTLVLLWAQLAQLSGCSAAKVNEAADCIDEMIRDYAGGGCARVAIVGRTTLAEQVPPGEVIFVLRGQDRIAPRIVRLWADLALDHGLPFEEYQRAQRCADAMVRWAPRKWPD